MIELTMHGRFSFNGLSSADLNFCLCINGKDLVYVSQISSENGLLSIILSKCSGQKGPKPNRFPVPSNNLTGMAVLMECTLYIYRVL